MGSAHENVTVIQFNDAYKRHQAALIWYAAFFEEINATWYSTIYTRSTDDLATQGAKAAVAMI